MKSERTKNIKEVITAEKDLNLLLLGVISEGLGIERVTMYKKRTASVDDGDLDFVALYLPTSD